MDRPGRLDLALAAPFLPSSFQVLPVSRLIAPRRRNQPHMKLLIALRTAASAGTPIINGRVEKINEVALQTEIGRVVALRPSAL